MQIAFSIDNTPASLTANNFTGQVELAAEGKTTVIQSKWHLFSHFGFSTRKTWHITVGQHDVAIEMHRHRIFAPLREKTYRISVDGQQVAEQTGR